jgi:hypothetical protein
MNETYERDGKERLWLVLAGPGRVAHAKNYYMDFQDFKTSKVDRFQD